MYDHKRREEVRDILNEYHDALGPHNEVYTDGVEINEIVGAAAIINGISRMVRRLATICQKGSQIIALSLPLKLQPSAWHWTIIRTWILDSTML